MFQRFYLKSHMTQALYNSTAKQRVLCLWDEAQIRKFVQGLPNNIHELIVFALNAQSEAQIPPPKTTTKLCGKFHEWSLILQKICHQIFVIFIPYK